jgi:hypothetical protein
MIALSLTVSSKPTATTLQNMKWFMKFPQTELT